jgi:hypothetical protein
MLSGFTNFTMGLIHVYPNNRLGHCPKAGAQPQFGEVLVFIAADVNMPLCRAAVTNCRLDTSAVEIT